MFLFPNVFTANLMQSNARLTNQDLRRSRDNLCACFLSDGESKLCEAKCGCTIEHFTKRKFQADNEVLDAAGNHGLLCNPGVKPRRATLLERALEGSFRRAGGNPARQPATYSLLGEVFSKDDVSRLFPGKLSAAESEKRKKPNGILGYHQRDAACMIINALPILACCANSFPTQ